MGKILDFIAGTLLESKIPVDDGHANVLKRVRPTVLY